MDVEPTTAKPKFSHTAAASPKDITSSVIALAIQLTCVTAQRKNTKILLGEWLNARLLKL
jgi:hypothetical protein